MVRSVAKPGDLIFGFAANSLHRDNRLIYIARVTGKLSDGKYYDDKSFQKRGDCIYQRRGKQFFWRSGSLHHGSAKHLLRDLGKPTKYPRANVLLSKDFRYFGVNGSFEYKTRYPIVRRAIENLGRGFRVNFGERLRSQLQALQKQTWKETRRRVAGKPTSPPDKRICYRSQSCGIIRD
jgi:hypothetical protein